MKLKKLSPIITGLARQNIGGFGMYLQLGVRHSTLPEDAERDTRSVNLESFKDHDDTDLWDTMDGRSWRREDVPENCQLDFYVYDREELKDNLGILIRGGKIVAWSLVGDKLNGSYDAWRPIDGGELQPRSFFKEKTNA